MLDQTSSGPSRAELASQYAAELADYLPTASDRAALTQVVANAIWCGDEIAAQFAEALLSVIEGVAFAVHDAAERGECEHERFRSWIGSSLEVMAAQIVAVERHIAAVAPGIGHA